ncbi:DUF3558 domain-containing protein [Nocardia higoensis]|uniref:DUF3558 domain-containing protein n=1 Tax=Nocardia higoensis TaxID=228599 RepID=A0ABS0DAW9_9NOCA|nr:DUF3558 domain-containing protein [Nocardia higoensis]MBF6354029.1 DUF3558 domain-containing protein [Nocardia higoensis]
MRTVRAVIAATAVLATTAGCSSTEAGTATPTTQAMDNLLNPCTDVPDEWLIETGLDPATEQNSVNPTEVSSWRICGWDAMDLPYMVDLMSSSKTLEETRNSTTVIILGDTTIGARPALITRVKSDSADKRTCYVTFPAEQGSFTISLGWRASRPITADRCELAIKHATDLERHLPK